jgi:hypothetical protein
MCLQLSVPTFAARALSVRFANLRAELSALNVREESVATIHAGGDIDAVKTMCAAQRSDLVTRARMAISDARRLLQPVPPDPASPEGRALADAREHRRKEAEHRGREAAEADAKAGKGGKAGSPPPKGKVPAAPVQALPEGVELGSDESLGVDVPILTLFASLFDTSSGLEANNRLFCAWLRTVASLL